MEIMTSPYKLAPDSPSRQLLYELSRLAITTQENLYARLDRESEEREAIHHQALVAAAAEHDRIRRGAEQERERLELQLQIEREKREDEERRELERKRQEKAERENVAKKKELERIKAAEAVVKRKSEALAARNAEIAAAERARVDKERQAAEIARQRKDTEDQETKKEAAKQALQRAKDAAVASQKKSQTNQPPNLPSIHSISSSPLYQNPEREVEHQRYIEIHRNLKNLRKFMMSEARKPNTLKNIMGNMRREIKKSVGQITDGKGANRAPFKKIVSVFKTALQVAEPKVEITLFLANPPSSPPAEDTKAPALLIYLINIFAKAIVSQFIDEAGVSPKTADPVGVLASNVFAMDDFRWQGLSLIDILISKMHVVCPVLWGIYGEESTTEGKTRLGWWREEKDGPWVSEQRHQERMTGLGAGFASLALRKYEKARAENPYPNIKYWQSFAAIINVPQQMITTTHFVVLKAMIEGSELKFLELFGNAGLAALRTALVEYPTKTAQPSVAAKALAGLADVLRRDKKLCL